MLIDVQLIQVEVCGEATAETADRVFDFAGVGSLVDGLGVPRLHQK
jgi:hypothetical protein